MAAVPSRGRAAGVVERVAPEAEATRALYERYGNQIFGFCLHQLGSREEAEDAVQSTFLNAFRGLARGIVPESEQAWLFKIAHNVCLSRRRSSWRRGRIESPTDFELVQESSPAPHRRADELIGLQDVLQHLPEYQRRAILLREWQGLSYREIAEELDLSQAAVETLIFRARRALARGLEASPQEHRSWRARFRRSSLGLGNVAALLKPLLASGVAVKAAGTAAVVAVASFAAATTPTHHGVRLSPAPAPAQHVAAPLRRVSPAPATGAAATQAAGRVRRAVGHWGAAHAARRPTTPSPSSPAQPLSSPAPAVSTPSPAAASSQPAAPAPVAQGVGHGNRGADHALHGGALPAAQGHGQQGADHGHRGRSRGTGHDAASQPAQAQGASQGGNGSGSAGDPGHRGGSGDQGGSGGGQPQQATNPSPTDPGTTAPPSGDTGGGGTGKGNGN